MPPRLRKMANAANRVLVNFVRDYNKPNKAEFTESILDSLGLVTGNEMPIYVGLNNNCLLLGNKPWAHQQKPAKIRRPEFCPIHKMSKNQREELPSETASRGIDVGCAVILESGDGKILLTRRATHLRTFPNVWVPPGGHVEFGETLCEAGLRELKEETGLSLAPAQCVNQQVPVLALWESAYPPMLPIGLPKRHHAVVYLYAKLTSDLTSTVLDDQLCLDESEVGASAWIDRSLIKAIVAAKEGTDNQQQANKNTANIPETISVRVVQSDGTSGMEDLDTNVLLQTATGDTCDVERVSTGTKFALEEWLHQHHHKKH